MGHFFFFGLFFSLLGVFTYSTSKLTFFQTFPSLSPLNEHASWEKAPSNLDPAPPLLTKHLLLRPHLSFLSRSFDDFPFSSLAQEAFPKPSPSSTQIKPAPPAPRPLFKTSLPPQPPAGISLVFPNSLPPWKRTLPTASFLPEPPFQYFPPPR